jgi:hypothetical protein
LDVSADTTLDFVDSDADFDRLHYAFLVTEAEFDEIFSRIKERRIAYWSGPMHNEPDGINTWTTGAGCTSMTPTDTAWRYSPGRTAAAGPKPRIRIRSWLRLSIEDYRLS